MAHYFFGVHIFLSTYLNSTSVPSSKEVRSPVHEARSTKVVSYENNAFIARVYETWSYSNLDQVLLFLGE